MVLVWQALDLQPRWAQGSPASRRPSN